MLEMAFRLGAREGQRNRMTNGGVGGLPQGQIIDLSAPVPTESQFTAESARYVKNGKTRLCTSVRKKGRVEDTSSRWARFRVLLPCATAGNPISRPSSPSRAALLPKTLFHIGPAGRTPSYIGANDSGNAQPTGPHDGPASAQHGPSSHATGASI